MKYLVERNFVQVIGPIWQPGCSAAQEQSLSSNDVDNILDHADCLTGERKLSRKAIARWLARNMGDFSEIDDFRASIGDEEFPWADEESERVYHDAKEE